MRVTTVTVPAGLGRPDIGLGLHHLLVGARHLGVGLGLQLYDGSSTDSQLLVDVSTTAGRVDL